MNHGHQFDTALLVERKARKKLEAVASDLLDMLKMTLREWYPRIDGCAKPDCMLCIRRKQEMKQVEAAITKAER